MEPVGPETQGTTGSFGLAPKTLLALPLLYPFTAPPATNMTLASAWSVPPLSFWMVVRPNSESVMTTRSFHFTLSLYLVKYFFKPYIAQPIERCRFEWLPVTPP